MSEAAIPSRREVWVHMLLYPRHTLPTALAPVMVACGLAYHDRVFSLLPALAALLAGWLIQLGGVIADNYNNLKRHGDDREHPEFVRALHANVITFRELGLSVLACFAVAALAGLYLAWVGGLPVIIIGVASMVAALAYSTGPFPLGDNMGLGDPLFFVFFGLVSVMGTYLVQVADVLGTPMAMHLPDGALTLNGLLVSLPVAALTTNILVIDNIRDREFDLAKNERTLAVIVGPVWSRVEYVALLVLAYAVPVYLWWGHSLGPSVLLPLLSIPYGAVVARRVLQSTSHQQLIPMTPQAGQVLVAHALLFTVGLVLG